MDLPPRQLYYHLRKRLLKQKLLKEFDHNCPSVFVLSTGRVGTQTLAALFGLAANVFAYHEPKPKLYGLSKLSYEYSDDTLISTVLQEAFLTTRKELLNYSLDCGRGYIETSPQTTFLVPVILEVIPNVRFLHIVRNPRDVVRSAMRRKWYEGHSADQTRIVPLSDSEENQQWQKFSAFQKNLWLWHETNRWILKFTSNLPADRTLLVHSEDIFNGNEGVLQKLYTFVGAPMPPKQKTVRILNKKLNKQREGTFLETTNWSEDMKNDLLSIAGKTARALGYEF